MLRIELVPSLNALQLHLLYGGALIAVSLALLAFLTSEVTRNYSQIDKLWSLIPPIFAWYFAGASGWEPRLVLMAVLATAWGARLTFNFWRRGGYAWPPWSGVEDYRWAVLRAQSAARRALALAALQSRLRVALPGPAAAAHYAALRRGGRRGAATQPARCRRCRSSSSPFSCSRPPRTSSSTSSSRRSTGGARR